MSDEELKPCPFCGMDWLEVHVKGSERGPAYQVVCSECGASGPVAEREREVAMTAWNTHHTTFDPPYGKPHNQQTYEKPHIAPQARGTMTEGIGSQGRGEGGNVPLGAAK